jgi:hypothetical protein
MPDVQNQAAWTWSHYSPSKCLHLLGQWHSVTFQKTRLLTNPALLFYFLKYTHIRSSFTSFKVLYLKHVYLHLFYLSKTMTDMLHLVLQGQYFTCQLTSLFLQNISCDSKSCSAHCYSVLPWVKVHVFLVQCIAVTIRFSLTIFLEDATDVFLWLPEMHHIWHTLNCMCKFYKLSKLRGSD